MAALGNGIFRDIADIVYDEDSIVTETVRLGPAQVIITEGTYTSLLKNADIRVFIARNYRDTREHREKRVRNKAELDDFVEHVLKIEHDIISRHRDAADFIINKNYEVDCVRG